jgi:hypothetical protein
MKRYDLESTGWDHEEMVERPLGGWCEWDEVDAERAKDKEKIARLMKVLGRIWKDAQGFPQEITTAREALEGG